MKKLGLVIVGAAVVALMSGSAWAQSAKFAATFDTDVVMVEASVAGPTDGSGGTFCDPVSVDCDVPRLMTEFDLAKMHVPQSKEVLIGVSGVVNLITFTQAKGKNTNFKSTAIAEGAVGLTVKYAPEGTENICAVGETAAPGTIVFSSRRQELSVTVDLDVVDDLTTCDTSCIADTLNIEGSVTVALGLDTSAAHHFNFVAYNLDSNWYDIVACYDLTALAIVSGDDIDDDTFATAMAAIGPRMLTLQQVRATNNGIVDESGVSE